MKIDPTSSVSQSFTGRSLFLTLVSARNICLNIVNVLNPTRIFSAAMVGIKDAVVGGATTIALENPYSSFVGAIEGVYSSFGEIKRPFSKLIECFQRN